MADQMDVNLGQLPQHAAEHQSIATAWQDWPTGGESFIATIRRSHGVVAEPIVAVLEQYQHQRTTFAGEQADINQGVSDAITATLSSYRTREAQSSHALNMPVQGM
jgi:transglutaminase/protease-like cytokinesis protein 3